MGDETLVTYPTALRDNFFLEQSIKPCPGGVKSPATIQSKTSKASYEAVILGSKLVKCDFILRQGMALTGVLSCPRIFYKGKKTLQILATLWHISFAVLYSIATGLVITFGWRSGTEFELYTSGRLFTYIMLNGYLALSSWSFLILGLLNNGLVRYQQLAAIEESLWGLRITPSIKKSKLYQMIFVGVACCFILCCVAVLLPSFITPDFDRYILGKVINNTNNELETSLLRVTNRAALLMFSFQWSFGYAYYAHVCTTIWVLGNDFKNEMEKAVTTHPANTLSNLESFRLVHMKISGLIGQINTLLKWNFSFVFAINGVQLLCALYIASLNNNYIWISTLILTGFSLASFVFFCNLVHQVVSRLKGRIPIY